MADLNRKMAEGHTVSDLDTVIDEVYGARGEYDTLGDRLDEIDTVIDTAKLGIHYKGEVDYYSNLPTTGVSIGDAYTVKYSGSSGTTPDGTEYVWGTVSGTNHWINFSKDSYTKAEVDALLALKQNALTTAQLAAVNSGIDSEKVAQIETNKNNISLLAIKGGGYNFAKIGTNSYTGYGVTLTVANGVITISGTATGSFSLYLSGTISDTLTADSKLSSQLPTQIAFTGTPDTDNDNRIIFGLYNDGTWVYSGSTNDLYHDLSGKTYNNWLIYLPIVRGNTYNGIWRPMIIDKAVYDSGFTDFQPYAPSNAELYAMIQALQQ